MKIFNYECPKCKHEGPSSDLIDGYLCPACKNNFWLANMRQMTINDAILQTNIRIGLLSGTFEGGMTCSKP